MFTVMSEYNDVNAVKEISGNKMIESCSFIKLKGWALIGMKPVQAIKELRKRKPWRICSCRFGLKLRLVSR